MRYLVLAGLAIGCGDTTVHHLADAPAAPDAPSDAARDAARDAAPDSLAQACAFVASTSTAQDVLSYATSGGSFESFGCAPVDPTYWLSGAGMSVTATFVQPQDHPSVRVWGMNTDDSATVQVNGSAYPLSATTASLAPKVTCGLSPGPDGVAFVGGSLTGANTPEDGNFSYQDVTIDSLGVTSIELTGLAGAGWGFAGVSVGDCGQPTP